jgi:hypothetical protein
MAIETKLGQFFSVPFRPDEGLRIAVAYAKMTGVERLRASAGAALARAEVLVGLNDYVTEPAAIERLRELCSRVRTVESERGRFHPKLYWRRGDGRGSCYVGSANLTGSALDLNLEAGVVFEYEGTPPDDLKETWASWWDSGRPVDQTLPSYKQRFADQRPARAPEQPDKALARIAALGARHLATLSDGELLELRESIRALQARLPELDGALRARHARRVRGAGSTELELAGSLVRFGVPRRRWDYPALEGLIRRFGVPRARVFERGPDRVRKDALGALQAYDVPESEIENCRVATARSSIQVVAPSEALKELMPVE